MSTFYQKEFAESGFMTLKIFLWWNLAKRMSSLWFLWANWCSTGIFGVQYPFFGRLHPLFFVWIQTSIDLSKHLKKKADFLGEKMGIWPKNRFSVVPFIFRCVFRVKCPFFDKLQPFFILWITFFDQFHEIFKKKRHFGWKHSYLSSNWKFLKLQN